MAYKESLMKDVNELMARARSYEEMPHHLYSHIAVMADRYAADEDERLEIRRVMDVEYVRNRNVSIDRPDTVTIDWCSNPGPNVNQASPWWYPMIAMRTQQFHSVSEWIEVLW